MRTQIIIEDHVVPQLLTSAIEAYEMEHRTHARGAAKTNLETFGLLWGYALPARDNGAPPRLVAVTATVETSALRHSDWVRPSAESIRSKRDFFSEYWPQLELVGTFHSHPYDSLDEVNEARGWRASEGDHEYWPGLHDLVCPEMEQMAHLTIAITGLGRRGSAPPDRLSGNEYSAGYVFSADTRKFWIKGHTSERLDDHSLGVFTDDEVLLEIPSISQRFRDSVLRK